MSRPAVEVRELEVRFNGTPILDRVSFTVGAGQLVTVVGPNGAGKSTLVRCLDGIVQPAGGEVRLEGLLLQRYTRRELARTVSYVPQSEPYGFDFAVRDFVTMGRYPHLGPWEAPGADDDAVVAEAMELTETGHLAARSMASLSGGERQRCLIAAALAQGGRILLLDEPTTALDYRHQVQLVELIGRLHREQGLTVVTVTHDLNATVPISDAVVALKSGRVAFAGAPSGLLDAGVLAGIYDNDFMLVPVPGSELPLVVPARGDVRREGEAQ